MCIPLFSVHSHCNATSLQFQNILSPQKKPCSRQQSPHPLPQPLTTRNLLSVSVDLPALHVSHGWSHTLCVLLCLRLSLSIVSSGSVHVVPSVGASVLSVAEWCSPVCGTTVCVFRRRALGLSPSFGFWGHGASALSHLSSLLLCPKPGLQSLLRTHELL